MVAVIVVVPRLIAVVAVVVIVLVALVVVVVHFMRHINGRPKSHRRQVNKAATSYKKMFSTTAAATTKIVGAPDKSQMIEAPVKYYY